MKTNRKRTDAYSLHPEAAWEGRRDYYEHDGIRDTRTGWTKRLGLSPNGFGNRLELFKAGKIDESMFFRPAGLSNKIHKKYELKMPREAYIAIRKKAVRKLWENRERCSENHTIRIWLTVFNALKSIKPKTQSWSQFFIEKFGLSVKVPDAAKYSNPKFSRK